jgi:CRISPR-associated protein Cmr5
MTTFDQAMAEKAFELTLQRENNREYRSFAMSFPSLIHACGLVQAVAFAKVKNKVYLNDLTEVLGVVEGNLQEGPPEQRDLPAISRGAEAMKYMRLSRRALSAASWLKRCVQAFDNGEETTTETTTKEGS